MQPDIITPELLTKLERPFIVCLGGSTTEPFFVVRSGKYSIVANGTWAEELSRIMEKRKIKGTVFCGGMGGYTTANDLLKLLRDVLEIEPDIVISYGGVNDFCRRRDFKMHSYFSYQYTKNKYPKLYPQYFIFPNLLRYITRMRMKEGLTPIELYEGVKSKLNEAEYMIRNWKIMNEVCKLHDINFYAVVQPCVGSTERTRNEKELILEKWQQNNLNNDTLWRNCFDVLTKNYDLIKNEIPKYNFMYDFSGIFDEQDLSIIYPYDKDYCHVNQKGNRIVAENMFKMLFDNPTPVANLNNEETNHK
jgi:lysophospholipase L1-like esterase